jgi:hypothetical protein
MTTKRERERAKTFVRLVDWILPLPLTAAMYLLWRERAGAAFAGYTIALGLAFGYAVPAIGTNVLGLWRFNGPFRVGDFHLHHGFLYAPYLSLVLYLTWGDWDVLTAGQAATVVVSTGLAQALLSSVHDIQGVKAGAIEIFNARAEEGASAEAIVLDYGPIGFGLFGAAYAGACLCANRVLARGAGPGAFVGLVAGGVTLMGLTGIPYLVKERRFIGAARRSPRRAAP